MRRPASVLLALVVISAIAAVATPAGAAQTDVAIQSANTSIEQPAPGEPFTLTVSIANLQTSSGPVDVTDVYVRQSGSTREYARIEDVGTVAAGGSLAIPLTLSINEPGAKRLTVHAVVRDSDGDFRRVNYPLYVDVEEPDEAVLSFANLDPVAGQETEINVSVSNGDSGPLSNVRLELDGDARIENPERVSALIPAGTQTTHTYRVTFPETGRRNLVATVTYKTDEGSTRTFEREVATEVNTANVDTDLTASATEINGSSVIRTSLSEYGNVELRDVQIRALVDDQVVSRARGPDVPAGETRTATLDGHQIPAGDVTIVARYTAAGESRTTQTTLQYSPASASDITLTGIDVARDGSTLTLSGDVANVGTADARSVLVSIPEVNGVTPINPSKEYFVGAIDSSEFATFELTANVSADVDEVPVRIEYTVAGERLSRVVTADISDATGEPNNGNQSRSSGPSVVGIGLAGVVMLALIGGVYRWRKR